MVPDKVKEDILLNIAKLEAAVKNIEEVAESLSEVNNKFLALPIWLSNARAYAQNVANILHLTVDPTVKGKSVSIPFCVNHEKEDSKHPAWDTITGPVYRKD